MKVNGHIGCINITVNLHNRLLKITCKVSFVDFEKSVFYCHINVPTISRQKTLGDSAKPNLTLTLNLKCTVTMFFVKSLLFTVSANGSQGMVKVRDISEIWQINYDEG